MRNDQNNFRQYFSLSSKPHHSDHVIWFVTFALLAFGLVMVYSSSFFYAQEHFKDGLYFFKKHAAFLSLGILTFFAGYKISVSFYKKYINLVLGIILFGLVATLIPGISHKAGGASRWISFFGFTFQPSEFAKFGIILFVANQLSKKLHHQHNFRSGFLTYFIGTIPFYVLLLLQPDFGTTALCLGVTFIMLLYCGIRLKYLIGTILAIVPTATILVLSSTYRKNRLLGFLDPWSDPAHKGFQVIQSFLAFYSGKFFGVGLGNSREKLFYLPEAHNDFIFAVVGEELGLIGVTLIISLFAVLIHRGLKTSEKLDFTFEKAMAVGITTSIGMQAFLNMGVVLGLLPTKGFPLPLISYGGTSLISTLFLIGILSQLSERASE